MKEIKRNKVDSYACPRCPGTFGNSSHRDRHVRTVHEKRRDHTCPHCAAAFGQSGDLTRHMRAVHEKRKDHACPHCASAFSQASSLTTHVRAVHEKLLRGLSLCDLLENQQSCGVKISFVRTTAPRTVRTSASLRAAAAPRHRECPPSS